MGNHKATTFLTLALLAQPMQARDDGFSPVETVGIIGGICLGAYALGKGVQYLCTPSNETLMSKARDAQDQAYRHHDSTVRFLVSRNYDRGENTLCELQMYLGGSVHNYLNDMRYSLSAMRTAAGNLSERLRSLERKCQDCGSEYRRMEIMHRDLINAEATLSRAYEYIDRQSAYSVLYTTADEVYNQYAELLMQVGRYGGNRAVLAQ
jgi:hypothetical protein